MKDQDYIDKIIDSNTKLLIILGMASSLLMEIEQYIPLDKHEKLYWLLDSIEQLVYKTNKGK